MHLQSHTADFADKDRRDWLINLRFLRSSMQQTGWPQPVWSEAELLDVVGRIASNNFGIYTSKQRQQPQPQGTDAAVTNKGQHRDVMSASREAAADSAVKVAASSNGDDAGSHMPLSGADAVLAARSTGVAPWPMQDSGQQLTQTSAPGNQDSEQIAALGANGGPSARTSLLESLSLKDQAETPEHTQSDLSESATSHVEAKPIQAQGGRACGVAVPAKQTKEDVIGREVYITASYFNHSCEPNCVKNHAHGQQAGIASATALRDIKASLQSACEDVALSCCRVQADFFVSSLCQWSVTCSS